MAGFALRPFTQYKGTQSFALSTTLHSAKHKNAKKSENPFRGSTSCAASLRRAAHRMTGLEQSLRDPQSLMIGGKPQSNIPGSDCGRVCRSGAVSSTRQRSPWVNLRRSLRFTQGDRRLVGTPQHHSDTLSRNLTRECYPVVSLLSSNIGSPEGIAPIPSSGELSCEGQLHRR